jgi:hypothetical protein
MKASLAFLDLTCHRSHETPGDWRLSPSTCLATVNTAATESLTIAPGIRTSNSQWRSEPPSARLAQMPPSGSASSVRRLIGRGWQGTPTSRVHQQPQPAPSLAPLLRGRATAVPAAAVVTVAAGEAGAAVVARRPQNLQEQRVRRHRLRKRSRMLTVVPPRRRPRCPHPP